MLKGYPGLKNTAHLIAEYIPKCKIYVEPFAGLGRTVNHIKADKVILNDKSPYAFNYLTKHYNVKTTNFDFEESIRLYDSKNTFFLMDPPWRKNIYQNNDGPVCDRTPYQYYKKIFEIIENLQGNWILCCDKDEHEIRKICSKSKWYNHKIELNAFKKIKLFGKPIGVLLTSNLPFTRYHQKELF